MSVLKENISLELLYEMETIGKREPVAFGVRFLREGFTPDFGEKLEVSKEQVDH